MLSVRGRNPISISSALKAIDSSYFHMVKDKKARILKLGAPLWSPEQQRAPRSLCPWWSPWWSLASFKRGERCDNVWLWVRLEFYKLQTMLSHLRIIMRHRAQTIAPSFTYYHAAPGTWRCPSSPSVLWLWYYRKIDTNLKFSVNRNNIYCYI